jgi:hypothetical protein
MADQQANSDPVRIQIDEAGPGELCRGPCGPYAGWFCLGSFCPLPAAFCIGRKMNEKKTFLKYGIPAIILFGFILFQQLYQINVNTDKCWYGECKCWYGTCSGIVQLIIDIIVWLFITCFVFHQRRFFIRRSKGKESAFSSFTTAWCCIPCAFGQMGAYLNENPTQTV